MLVAIYTSMVCEEIGGGDELLIGGDEICGEFAEFLHFFFGFHDVIIVLMG